MANAIAWPAGGLLIAAKETYELIEIMEWEIILFYIAVIVTTVVSVSAAIRRIRSRERPVPRVSTSVDPVR